MSFKDIKGQDKPIQILKSYIQQSRLASGYLFVGPGGIGKALIAKTLAKAVNCQEVTLDTSTTLECHGEQGRTIDSCDRCASCLKIEKNQHPDVHYLHNSESDVIKIEHIRQLQKDINLKPYEAEKKVFIIDNAHYLTPEASNAILKILEEPPADTLIILISSKPALLFKTIISRCKIIRFSPILRIQLKETLKKDYGLDDDQAHFLAYFSEGRMGEALRLKDTDILREKNRIIDEFTLNKIGLTNLSIPDKEDVVRLLNILATWFRDIYLVKTGIPHLELINLDRKTQILRFMNHYSLFDLDDILNSISNSLLYLEQNINIKLLLSNLSEDISYGAKRT